MRLLKSFILNLVILLALTVTPKTLLGLIPIDPVRMDFSEITYGKNFQPKFRSLSEPTVEIPIVGSNNRLTTGGAISMDYYMFKHAETLNKQNDWDRNDQFRQRNEFSTVFEGGVNQKTGEPMVKAKFTIGNTLFLRTLFSPLDYGDPTIQTGSSLDFNQSTAETHFQEAWAQVNFSEIFKDNTDAQNYLKFGYFPFLVGRGISLGDWTQGGPTHLGFDRAGLQTYTPMFPGGVMWHGEIGKVADVELYFSPTVSENIGGAQRTGSLIVQPDVKDAYGRHIFAASARFYPKTKKAAIVINPYWVYYNSPRQSVEQAQDAPMDLHTFGCMVHAKTETAEINFEIAKQFGNQNFVKRAYQDFPSPDHYDFNTNVTANDNYYNWLDPSPEAQLVANNLNNTQYQTQFGFELSADPSNTGGSTATNSVKGDVPSFATYQSLSSTQKLGEVHPAFQIKFSGWMAALDARYSCKDYPLSLSGAVGYFSGGAYPYNDNVDGFWFSDVNETQSSTYQIIQAPFTVTPAANATTTSTTAAGTSAASGVGPALVNAGTVGRAVISPTPDKEYKGFVGLRDYRYVGMWAHPLILVNAGIVPRPKQISLFDFVAYNDNDSLTNIFYVGCAFDLKPLSGKDKNKLIINCNFFSYWTDDKLAKWDNTIKKNFKIEYAEGQSGGDLANFNGWMSSNTASSYLGFEVSSVITWNVTKNVEFSFRGGVFFPGQLYKDLQGTPIVGSQQANGMPNDSSSVTYRTLDSNNVANSTYTYAALGSDAAWGAYARVRYYF